ncbi:MAG: alpha/beta hydrolase [Aquincola sp.]|nr:alpha/beta hydrolase [Aquincola sp.]MDH4288300.1 alpha/beta hydrolase [Aquincola sp.]
MRVLPALLAGLLLIYVGVCVLVFVFQRSLQYYPDRSPMDPTAVGLRQVVVETLDAPDGERLVAWWIAPRTAQSPVYLYLHGNGANLHARAARLERLAHDGAGVLALSWRGYGGSSGQPSETGWRSDARTAYDALRSRGIASDRIVLYGESLGSAVAVMLAAEVPVRALLLDSSFDSALDVARRAYPWLPVRWLLRDAYRADLVAARVAVPVLQVHCEDDPITPLASALALQGRLRGALPVHRVPGRCHVPSLAEYDAVRAAFIGRVFARPGRPPP